MLSRILTNSAAVFIAILFFSCSPSPVDDISSIRIMPLGNSITQADSDHPGYRYVLWKLLTEGGYNFNFVGSLKANNGGRNPVQSFDTDHEGHWGWRADQILNGYQGAGKLVDFVKMNNPDIVLMHLGSNDIFRGESIQEIEADLTSIINTLISYNKDVIILIAQIIPVTNDQINMRIALLNKKIVQIKLNHSDKNIVVVNQFEGFNPHTDTYDGIHPNAAGEEKMAKKWYIALQSVMNRQS